MFLTFEQVQDSDISNIIAASPTDPQFGQAIVSAVNRLLPRGDWPGVVVPVHTCVQSGCVVWPREVHHVRKVADSRGNIPIHGMFYDYLDWRDRKWYQSNYWDSLGTRGRRNIVNKGFSPVFQDVLGPGRTIRMYHDASQDIGKTLTIFGVDNNNQKLRTQNPDGRTWSDGIILAATYPYAETSVQVLRIDRVAKQRTQGTFRIFGATYPMTNVFPSPIGWVYNMDTGAFISVTALGNPGTQYLQLGDGTPPVNALQVGYLYNYDLGQWRPVVARGQSPNYYLDFEQTTAVNSVYGGTVYNLANLAFTNIILRGNVGAQYAQLDGAYPPPTTVMTGESGLEPIAEYEPSDINPKFLKTSVYLQPQFFSPANPIVIGQPGPHGIVALCKLRQLPLSAPNDIVVIPSPEALKLAVQAVVAGEANEFQTENTYILQAVEQLNRELEDWLPVDQIPVDLGELGHSARIGRQRMF